MLFLRWRAVADRAACGGIIGAAHTLLSTMLTLPKSLPNRDALSRKSVNGWRTLPYICAVPVPNETNKEQIGTIAHSEQIKTNSAELWIWRGIKTPLLPNKPITADCPLYPQKQTSIERVGMSALCQKRTYALQQITGSLGQMLTDFGQELARAKWFRHVVITAGRPCGLLLTVERIRGDRDDRDRSQRWISLDPTCCGVTIHNRQLHIH